MATKKASEIKNIGLVNLPQVKAGASPTQGSQNPIRSEMIAKATAMRPKATVNPAGKRMPKQVVATGLKKQAAGMIAKKRASIGKKAGTSTPTPPMWTTNPVTKPTASTPISMPVSKMTPAQIAKKRATAIRKRKP